MSWDQTEPEWDWIDLAIHTAWDALNASLCVCGRPVAVHDGQTLDDYHTAYDECPAVAALDWSQAAKSIDDEDDHAAELKRVRDGTGTREDLIVSRLSPTRARTWLVWGPGEPSPI